VKRFALGLILSAAPAPAMADPAPERFLGGLAGLEAVAVGPQGVPFAALADSGGRIVRVVAPSRTHGLTETGGRPVALAFLPDGDLCVADRARGAIYRVTPWGRATLIADWLGSPEGVAAGADGSVWFTDSARGAVYRMKPPGEPAPVVTGIPGARGIVVCARTGRVYVSAANKRIWLLEPGAAKPREFAVVSGEGEPAGLVLDERGWLYVARDGGGAVSLLGSDGAVVASYRLPGARVVSLAFGGPTWSTLYVAEAGAGEIFRVRLDHRSQPLPWEPQRALRITSPRHGDILNRHDGELTPRGLMVAVEGVASGNRSVRVNGNPVEVAGGRFRTRVLLDSERNEIVAEEAGGARDAIQVFWDRRSMPRYRVSTDDNIRFLKDIARNADKYGSIFDNPYLAFWRRMHEKFGARIHHNIYYEMPGFNLSMMPEKFKDEWRQNASWMRLSFHARANDPDRPYVHASPEEILEDYRLVTREIERFAGPEVLSRFTTIHWGEATEAAVAALRREGVLGLVGYFYLTRDIPAVSYHLTQSETLNLMKRDYWKDTKLDVSFIRHDIVINNVPLAEIPAYLEKVAADPHQAEVMELMIHEPYFYPDYRAYLPDFEERVERAIEFVHRRGYRPVFYEEGFLGAGP
jgi:streptogramin lyase